MQTRLLIFMLVFSILVFILVLELIRRGRLREEYSLIWLLSSFFLFLTTVFRGTLSVLADYLQIEYAPAFIFMIGIGLLMGISLFQAIIISGLTIHIRELNQKLAIMDLQLRQLISNVNKGKLQINTNEMLVSINNEFQGQLNGFELIQNILVSLLNSFSANEASFFLINGKLKVIGNIIIDSQISRKAENEDLQVYLEEGLAGWVTRNNQPALIQNTLKDSRWHKSFEEIDAKVAKSVICVLVPFDQELMGVLTLIHREVERFDNHDLELLGQVASIIAVKGKPYLVNS